MSEITVERAPRSERSSQRVSSRVIAAVADARGDEPTALPPLYDSIDPDALDALFHGDDSSDAISAGDGSTDATDASADSAMVTFTTGGCEVVVESSGRVTATRAQAPVETTRES